MSTPHVPQNALTDEQQFLAMLDAAPQVLPNGAPPPLPPATAKIGDKEYSLEGLAQLLQEQSEELKRLKTLSALPEPEPEPRPAPQATPSTPPAKSAKWNAQTWAERTAQDPVAAQDLTLGQAWGLPEGVPASVAMQALVAQLQQIQQTQTHLQTQSANEKAQIEAERFVRDNADFERSPENSAVLQQYLASAGIPTDRPIPAAALTLAFKAAKADGALKGKTVTPPAPLSQVTQQQLQTRLPSVRQNQSAAGTSPDDTDTRSLFERLNKMPAQDAFDYIAKYEHGLGRKYGHSKTSMVRQRLPNPVS